MTVSSSGSLCGHPGDTGNDKGVGKYCVTQGDCGNNGSAAICTTAVPARMTFFCTISCPVNPAADFCGTAAHCQCDTSAGGCGCVPDACTVGLDI